MIFRRKFTVDFDETHHLRSTDGSFKFYKSLRFECSGRKGEIVFVRLFAIPRVGEDVRCEAKVIKLYDRSLLMNEGRNQGTVAPIVFHIGWRPAVNWVLVDLEEIRECKGMHFLLEMENETKKFRKVFERKEFFDESVSRIYGKEISD